MDIYNTHRPLLFGIAYRMLGSVMDAEDIVQETFLRWHGQADNPRAYLARITTNLCLDQLKSAAHQRETYIGPWLPAPLVTPPDEQVIAAESLSVAFLLLLQSLSPTERAALLLRDVFDFEYAEIGRIIDKSAANVRQIVRRSRLKVQDGRTRHDVSAETRNVLFGRFVQACSDGDLDGLLQLLAPDAVFVSDSNGKAAAARHPVVGSEKVAKFLLGLMRLADKADEPMSIQVQSFNGAIGIVTEQGGRPIVTLTLQMNHETIDAIYAMRNPDKLQHL